MLQCRVYRELSEIIRNKTWFINLCYQCNIDYLKYTNWVSPFVSTAFVLFRVVLIFFDTALIYQVQDWITLQINSNCVKSLTLLFIMRLTSVLFPAFGAPRILAFSNLGFSGISGCSIYSISCSAFVWKKREL